MGTTLISESLDDLPIIAEEILRYVFPHKKLLFYADMGVGKTTLIKELSLQLGVDEIVSSPTFSIINEYQTNKKEMVYHFDFYRIEEENEVFNIGYEEYFFGDAYCFIEWSEKISNLIHEEMVKIKISVESNKRRIEIII